MWKNTIIEENSFNPKIKMKIALCHFVQMNKYEIPDDIATLGEEVIEDYIFNNNIKPISSDTRDWEIVEIN